MVWPFVDDLFVWVRCYLESRGIALTVFRYVREVVGFGDVLEVGRLGRNLERVARFLWYVGFLKPHVDFSVRPPRITHYSLTERGKLFRDFLSRDEGLARAFLASVVCRWYPMRLLLMYLYRVGEASIDDIVRDLGSKVEDCTGKLLSLLREFLGLRRAVKKPFNPHVVDVLTRLGHELGVLAREGRVVRLTEYGEFRARELGLDVVEVVKTGPGYPLILGAILSILGSGGSVVLISPWIDRFVEERLVRGLKGLGVRFRRFIVVTRSEKQGELLCNEFSCEHYVFPDRPRLHSKIVLSDSFAVVSSANLTRSSLLFNVESGFYFRGVPSELREHVDELLAHARVVK